MKSNNSLYIITLICSINFLVKHVYADDSYLTTYGDCNSVPRNEEESKTLCSTIFNSDLCQNYYNNPEQVVGEGWDELDIATVNYHKEKAKAVCQYDENNKLCPIGQYYIDVATNSNVNEDEYMQESCKSNICAETAKNYLLAKEKFYSLKYPNKMDRFSVKFENEKQILECKTENKVNSKSNDSSGETQSGSSKSKKSELPSNSASSNNNSGGSNSSNKIIDTNTDTTEQPNNDDNTANPINEGVELEIDNSGNFLIIDEKLIFLISFILINILFF